MFKLTSFKSRLSARETTAIDPVDLLQCSAETLELGEERSLSSLYIGLSRPDDNSGWDLFFIDQCFNRHGILHTHPDFVNSVTRARDEVMILRQILSVRNKAVGTGLRHPM